MLNAYYFRQHMYTLVPRHVDEDLAWMADLGTDVLTLAVLEQDIDHARRNIDVVCAAADRRGMKVHAAPSRWGAIVAGAPKVPSLFTATHPETWITDAQGKPVYGAAAGPISSIYHPATRVFFAETVTKLLARFPLSGVVWDEPKVIRQPDFSPASPFHAGGTFVESEHIAACVTFFNEASAAARAARPDVTLSMFLQAHYPAAIIDAMATCAPLDYYGCDGRPWFTADGGTLEANDKTLLDRAPAFLAAARAHGKRGLVLIENHNLATEDYDLLDRRLPEVMKLGADQVIYYYFPRNLEDPDRVMGMIAKHVRAAR